MGVNGDRVRLSARQPKPVLADWKILLREVEGTPHTFSSSVEDVRVDHCRSDVPVSQ